MFRGMTNKRIKVRLGLLIDQNVPIPHIEKHERAFIGYIRNLVNILDQSPSGRALTGAAVVHQVSLGLDPLLEPSGSHFYPAQNHFDLGYQPDLLQKTEKGLSRYMISFIGALRRAWHYHKGHCADASLKPEFFLRQFRCEEADIEAILHLVAWELRAAGQTFLWRSLLCGPNGDIAHVFERTVEMDPHAQFDGDALKMAFNQWFSDRERVNATDHFALDLIDMAMLQCENRSEIGRRALPREKLQMIGKLPNGQNYLSGCFFTNPWYDGLDDEFNRMHLHHILNDMAQVDVRSPT